MLSYIEIDDSWDKPTTCGKYGLHKSWHTRYIKKNDPASSIAEKDLAMNEDLNTNLQ